LGFERLGANLRAAPATHHEAREWLDGRPTAAVACDSLGAGRRLLRCHNFGLLPAVRG
jgi:hypothetical protein